MQIKDYLKNKEITGYFVLDTKEDTIDMDLDKNYVYYEYNVHKYNKMKENDVFLYRQPKKFSSNRKFFFFGGGRVEKIEVNKETGIAKAYFKECFKLVSKIYEDEERFDEMIWTTKEKKKGSWDHFWNQYGMNVVSREEFVSIIGDNELMDIFVSNIEKKDKPFYYTEKNFLISKNNVFTAAPRKVEIHYLNDFLPMLYRDFENIVYHREVEFLKSKGLGKEVKREHKIGEKDVFDLVSYDEKGEEIYIDIKIKLGNNRRIMKIPKYDVERSMRYKERYIIYYLSDINLESHTYSMEIYNGRDICEIINKEKRGELNGV